MRVIIRGIELTDAAAIVLLSAQLSYPANASVISENIKQLLLNSDYYACVAIVEKQVVGWLHCFYALRLGSAPFCEVGGMVVDRQFRKAGIGRQLMEHATMWAKTKQVTTLRVRCNTNRTDSHAFYERIGMKQHKHQLVFELPLG